MGTRGAANAAFARRVINTYTARKMFADIRLFIEPYRNNTARADGGERHKTTRLGSN